MGIRTNGVRRATANRSQRTFLTSASKFETLNSLKSGFNRGPNLSSTTTDCMEDLFLFWVPIR